jgi:hypothetical protein
MSKISINLDSLKPKKEWKRHKIKEGHNVFRILPPFGDTANGYPYRKWMVIWGMLDPESGRARPFASSLTTEKQCPIFEYVDALQKKAEGIKAKMQTSGASEEDIKEALKPLNKVISTLRPKTVYAYNAIDKAGVVGILEVKATAQKILKELMMTYIKDYNQDPTSLNSEQDDSGVWFDFIRTGQYFDTEYDVEKLQTKAKVNGQMTYIDDRSPLPDNVVENYADLAYDLSSIYQVKTYDELREVLMANLKNIVKEVPEARIAGFDDFTNAATIKSEDADDAPPARQAAKPAATAKPAAKNVNLNLADDGDDVDTGNGAVSAVTINAEDEDIFALADSILQN